MEVRRADDRFVTRSEGRTTWHSFSFGAHYDPAEIGFGALVAHNDEHLPPGIGYDEHLHRDVEIVSVVLAGSLHHTSAVGDAVLGPGDVQRLSAGDGVRHREWSAVRGDQDGPVTRFVQTWLRPSGTGGAPSYAVVRDALPHGHLALIDTGARTDATLRGGILTAGNEAALAAPPTDSHHVFVAEGSVTVICEDTAQDLSAGDAARVVDETVTVLPRTTAVVLVWTTPAS